MNIRVGIYDMDGYHVPLGRFVAMIAGLLLIISVSTPTTDGKNLDLTCYCTRGKCYANSTCMTDGVCYAIGERKEGSKAIEYVYGCFLDNELFPRGRPLVCQNILNPAHKNVVECCDNTSLCNKHIQPTKQPPEDEEPESRWVYIVVAVGVGLALFCIVGALILYIHFCVRGKWTVKGKQRETPLLPSDPSPAGGTLADFRDECSQYTGSGSGLPLLIQRTIARQIQLEAIIGKGRYGEVWRGSWRGESVAVKIFHSREERSWFREAEIYQTVMLRHDNVLGFIAADNKDNGTWTQLWLITDCHAHGSLFDYLNTYTVDLSTMSKMALSIASGLAHLHIEITGTQGKPGIAHRDLKSKNILVKSNLTCCIADLGLAVKHDFKSDTIDMAENSRVGTRRYMAPEVIDDTMEISYFDSFKRADVYALGLVYWELVRRCTYEPGWHCEDYQLPYYNMVQSDPTHEEIHKVVCVERRRPEIPNTWKEREPLRVMSQIMNECWCHSPAARLSALRVRKNIVKMIENEDLKV